MKVSEVRIQLISSDESPGSRLLACFSVSFDHALVVHGVKLIDGPQGKFVAMPSERIRDHCPLCARQNPVNNRYCGHCGTHLGPPRVSGMPTDRSGKLRIYSDVVHPLGSWLRQEIQDACIDTWEKEITCSGSCLPLFVKRTT